MMCRSWISMLLLYPFFNGKKSEKFTNLIFSNVHTTEVYNPSDHRESIPSRTSKVSNPKQLIVPGKIFRHHVRH